MKIKNFLKAAEVAVGTGLFLLAQSERMTPRMRHKLRDQFDDLRDRASVAYEAAADRVAHVSKSLRRSNNHRDAWTVLRFAAGLGIGVGIGLLVAPAKGEQTRNRLTEKAHVFKGSVRRRFIPEDLPATGTGD
jgi:hypothetical protein